MFYVDFSCFTLILFFAIWVLFFLRQKVCSCLNLCFLQVCSAGDPHRWVHPPNPQLLPCSLSPLVGRTNIKPKKLSKVQYVRIYPKFNMPRSIQFRFAPCLLPPSHSPPSTISSSSSPVVHTNKCTCSDYYCNTIGYNSRIRYINYDSQHSLLSNTYNTACSDIAEIHSEFRLKL